MKKVIVVFIIIIVSVTGILVGIYAYYGGFNNIVVEVKKTGGETFVYLDMKGDYGQSPVYMDSVYYSLLNNYSIKTTKGAGIYYDRPDKVDTNLLRSEVGCFLDNPVDSATLSEISKTFKIKTIPETDYIVSEIPYKGTLSIFVGIMKVYPAINKFMEENGIKDSPVIEIYDEPSKTITYRKIKN